MDWNNSEEKYLNKLHHESHSLSEYNRKQYIKYIKISKQFSIPILILSSLNGLFALSLQPFLKQDYISVLNACISLTCGVLGSIQLFMKIDEKIHNYIICSHEFNKLSIKISKELNLEPNCRHVKGRDFLMEIFSEFNTILDKQEVKEKSVKEYLLLPQETYTESVSLTDISQHL